MFYSSLPALAELRSSESDANDEIKSSIGSRLADETLHTGFSRGFFGRFSVNRIFLSYLLIDFIRASYTPVNRKQQAKQTTDYLDIIFGSFSYTVYIFVT